MRRIGFLTRPWGQLAVVTGLRFVPVLDW